jgi:secreted Zn-dependent insulinase-like peptidase
MAHFTEHMSFKGTRRRSSRQVFSAMESVGGELNAFTGKEETVYYCTCLKEHVARAIDLLLDITLSSTYPQEEMNREAEVVIDEIESYLDQPSEMIFDEFESLLFPGHPLGRNILGDAETLRTFRSDDMKRFAQRLYHPERMVLYVLGNVEPEKVLREVEKIDLPHPSLKGRGSSSPLRGGWEGSSFHMFPDRDLPGEQLFLQLQKVLPNLQHHQLPPSCKDFSDYYLQHLKPP